MKFFVILVVILSTSLNATTIRHMSLEELCFKSDLIAHVEVTVAGGIYSKYKVLKSYKGSNHNDEIIIKTQPGPHAPYFPSDYVGEKFIILGSKNNRTQLMSTSSGGANAMAWREIPYDYILPLWQGKFLIKSTAQFKRLETRIQSFLHKNKQQLKAHFLKEFCATRLGSINSRRGRINISCRRFLLAKTEGEISSAYEFLNQEEKSSLNLRGVNDKKEIIEIHNWLTENIKINQFDKISILPDEEFMKQWDLLKTNTKDSNVYEQLVKFERDAEETIGERNGENPSIRNGSLDTMMPKDLFQLSSWLQNFREKNVKLDDERIRKVYEHIISKMDIEGETIYGIYEILKIELPKNQKELTQKLKLLKFNFNPEVQRGLLALLGNQNQEDQIFDYFKNASSKFDSSDSYERNFQLHVLAKVNREKFNQLASNLILRPLLIRVLLKEESLNKIKISELLEGLNADQIYEIYRHGHQKTLMETFPSAYKKLPLKERIEDAFDELSFGEKKINSNLEQEILDYSDSNDERSIIMGAYYLAYASSSRLFEFFQKHTQSLVNNKYISHLTRVYCSKLDEDQLLKTIKEGNAIFHLMAANYLVIKDEKYIPLLKPYLESIKPSEKLQTAICLAERGITKAVDALFEVEMTNLEDTNRDERIFYTYVLGRAQTLFSNMSDGKTNDMSWNELKSYWQNNKQSYYCPWRKILDKHGFE